MLRVVVVLMLVAPVGAVHAEPRHVISLEVLGKGGLWGLAYDYRLKPRVAVGAVSSYYQLAGDRYFTFSPYVMAYPVRGEHSGWFAQLGPQLLQHTTPSPVPEWQGMSTTTFTGEVSTGYEYQRGFVARVYGMLSVGDHVAPWVGASFGWQL